jgi:DNA-binding transcriptional ArsR family regulator
MSLDRISPEAGFDAVAVPLADLQDTGIAGAISDRATEAAAFLKALSHEGRLMILCHLAGKERSVTELETLLGARQAAVSQQLARLRLEGLVATRRDGKAIIYTIQDARVLQQVRLMKALFGVTAD